MDGGTKDVDCCMVGSSLLFSSFFNLMVPNASISVDIFEPRFFVY